jgi:hypothetical protein
VLPAQRRTLLQESVLLRGLHAILICRCTSGAHGVMVPGPVHWVDKAHVDEQHPAKAGSISGTTHDEAVQVCMCVGNQAQRATAMSRPVPLVGSVLVMLPLTMILPPCCSTEMSVSFTVSSWTLRGIWMSQSSLVPFSTPLKSAIASGWIRLNFGSGWNLRWYQQVNCQ